ncbi:MAG: hypothetical protein LE178_02895 [Endomicrobium sp.]|nr:hypothetical protein [Endomicrobium sp.]
MKQGEQVARAALKNPESEVDCYIAKDNDIEYPIVYVKNSVEANLAGAIDCLKIMI